MRFSLGVAATLVALTTATSHFDSKSPEIHVKIASEGDSKIKATISNAGLHDVKLLTSGSLFDSAPLQKAHVWNADGQVEFEGVRFYYDTTNLTETHFRHVGAGKSIEVQFDIAETFNLSRGGRFAIQSTGRFQYALDGDTQHMASVDFASNIINAKISEKRKAANKRPLLGTAKRAVISTDCTGVQRDAVLQASQNTANFAVRARDAATTGYDAKLIEYFKDASPSTRDIVSSTFDKMATLYGSAGGLPELHCGDVAGFCAGNVVAYTLVGEAKVVFCDPWFSSYQALVKQCRVVDRVFISVHEATHLPAVRGTNDYNTYGYDGVRSLSMAQNLNHADTFAYFAHDVVSDC